MTVLNVALCLPELEVLALEEGESIVTLTQRFIVPDKSFVLVPHPTSALSYKPQWQARAATEQKTELKAAPATHWAQCVLCQPLSPESDRVTIAERTLWTEAGLTERLQAQGSLFLCIVRVYELPEAAKSITPFTQLTPEQLFKFLPLPAPGYLEFAEVSPVLSEAQFREKKEALLAPATTASEPPDEVEPADPVNSPDWVSNISKYGNSSDGHTFEKLVRKALIELGFSNSSNPAYLAPDKTGGAGGLDFFADSPFSLIGECKATSKQKVNSNATAQLLYLGISHLAENYQHCVKLVVAAGELTAQAHQAAVNHHINVIRPETLQALVVLNAQYPDTVDLWDFKACLERSPFSTEADTAVSALIDNIRNSQIVKEQAIRQRQQILSTVKELSQQPIHPHQKAFTLLEIRAHHNAKYQPLLTNEALETLLEELASPFVNCLERKQLYSAEERFCFVKDLSTSP